MQVQVSHCLFLAWGKLVGATKCSAVSSCLYWAWRSLIEAMLGTNPLPLVLGAVLQEVQEMLRLAAVVWGLWNFERFLEKSTMWAEANSF